VHTKRALSIVATAVAVLAFGGCGSQQSSSSRNRAITALEACRAHDGVKAFDDDAVICGDGTAVEERGAKAVTACRGHGGVSAFDDDIVICEDQSFHRAEGG
jgi:hypothetical protein